MTRGMLMLGVVALASLGAKNACDYTPSSAQTEFAKTEHTQQALLAATPLPTLTHSAERINLSRRLQRLNVDHMTSYIYLISQSGKVMAFYPVDGKVTSLNAYLTPDTRPYGSSGSEVEVPDLDGTYGKNADGVFFFTTEGVYVEWKGDYLMSDQPLKLAQPPELIYVIPQATR